MGTTNIDQMNDVSVDSSDHAVAVGSFFSVSLDGLPQFDVAVARYHPTGELDDTLVRGVLYNDEGLAIASSSDGRTAVTGGFRLIQGGPNVWTTPPSTATRGGTAILVSHVFSSSGFSTSFDSAGRDTGGTDIALDPTGGLTITGKGFVSPFGSLPIEGSLAYNYAARVSSTGQVLAARYFPGSGDRAAYVALDAQSNLYVVGTFFSSNSYDFGGGELTSAGEEDIFIAKYSGLFTHVWSKRFGGSRIDRPYSVVLDSGGNILVTGCFSATIDFGGGPLTSTDQCDVFVAKLSPAGDEIWAKRFGGCGADYGTDIAVDGAGNVAVVGVLAGPVDFGGGTLRVRANQPGPAFAVKLSPVGAHVWSRTFSFMYGSPSVAMDSTGAVLMGSNFIETVSFGGPNLVSVGQRDGLMVKFSP